MSALSIRPGDPKPLASSHDVLVRRCAEEMDRYGISWKPLARSHGIRLSERREDGARLSVHSERAMLRDASRATRDPFLGWTLGRFELRDLGIFGYAVRSAPDVRSALHTLIELFALLSEGPQIVLHEENGEATLASTIDLGSTINQVGLRMTLSHMHELAGPDFHPLRTGLPESDPDILVGLCERAGTRVERSADAVSYVTFDADLLNRPLHDADSGLALTLRRIWDEERERLHLRTTALLRLQRAIMAVLPFGQPTPERVAESLGASVRDLRKELKSLNINLPRATDMVRAGLIDRLLAQPGMTLERAAKALGYTEAGALARAHVRWHGAPPRIDGGMGPLATPG